MIYQILGVLHVILFLLAAYEVLTSTKAFPLKVLWLLLIFLLPIVGLIIYVLIGRGR
ncbi:MAG: PLDc N-terminal domain-containing protein [Planctomycetaceae bacterium]|jgi:hypothetical protein|nr:PLDc N-terminal domain-containing protein [Phycisphaerales bacterium]MCE2652724.1 PLDc N-terminal domain-containing protein [Planctomycetaceae bacterium]